MEFPSFSSGAYQPQMSYFFPLTPTPSHPLHPLAGWRVESPLPYSICMLSQAGRKRATPGVVWLFAKFRADMRCKGLMINLWARTQARVCQLLQRLYHPGCYKQKTCRAIHYCLKKSLLIKCYQGRTSRRISGIYSS